MGYITLNNYDDSYANTDIEVASWIWYQYENGETITDKNGVVWTVIADEDNTRIKYTLYNSTETYYTLDDFVEIARSLHLGTLTGFLTADIIGKYPTSERFGTGTDSLQQPYMDFYSLSQSDCNWGITINNTRFGWAAGFAGFLSYCLTPLCVYPNEEKSACRYGALSVYQTGGGGRTMGIEIIFYKQITDALWGMPQPEPGEPGFIPTGARTSKHIPGIGGRGSEPGERPRYKGDPVTQPGVPDESQASAVGSGFINCYMIDTSNLNKVGQCLYGSTLLGLLQSLSINPLDFIISLMVFPTQPDVGAAENIKLGGWLAAAAGGAALGFDASGNRLASQFKVVDFGTLQIPENWGSFLDYESQIELYLPFIGTVSIDVSECMAGSINVQYTIDFFTGMCVANVLCSKPAFVLPNGDVIQNVEAQHAYQGNCAIQIPLSAINYGNMVGSLINACTQGITNPVAGMINAGETALSGGFRPSVTSKGNIVANSGFCSVLYPYIRITRPITAEPESFQEVLGYPSYINTTLGECEGLCVCEDIDIEGITGATENELSRIKSLCSEGVYI